MARRPRRNWHRRWCCKIRCRKMRMISKQQCWNMSLRYIGYRRLKQTRKGPHTCQAGRRCRLWRQLHWNIDQTNTADKMTARSNPGMCPVRTRYRPQTNSCRVRNCMCLHHKDHSKTYRLWKNIRQSSKGCRHLRSLRQSKYCTPRSHMRCRL